MLQQYIFDAVAEFKAGKLISRVNPDSVRSIKNNLLRARAQRLDNADTEVRAQAEAELFGLSLERSRVRGDRVLPKLTPRGWQVAALAEWERRELSRHSQRCYRRWKDRLRPFLH